MSMALKTMGYHLTKGLKLLKVTKSLMGDKRGQLALGATTSTAGRNCRLNPGTFFSWDTSLQPALLRLLCL